MPFYIQLDEFYKSLSKDKIGVDCVCMDIVDSVCKIVLLNGSSIYHIRQNALLNFY